MLMIPNVITMEYKEVDLFHCGVGDREHLLQCQCEVIINLEYYRYTPYFLLKVFHHPFHMFWPP